MEHAPVRIVAFHEDGVFVAHCVDHDISAQAEKLDEAIRRLRLTVEAERRYSEEKGAPAFDGIGRPPEYVERMYEKAQMNVKLEGVEDFKLAA